MEEKDNNIAVKPYSDNKRKIYGYTLPESPLHINSVNIGQTERESDLRIKENQGQTGYIAKKLFVKKAQKNNGVWFTDKEFHKYLLFKGYNKVLVERRATEWFKFPEGVEKAEELLDEYIALDYDFKEKGDNLEYVLREEQQKAVDITKEYYNKVKDTDNEYLTRFLWNAKPRFGKTLTAYDFMLSIGARHTLIVTNRPAISNSWYDDFKKFIAHKAPNLKFYSDTDSLKDKAITRDEFVERYVNNSEVDSTQIGQVAFVSLQDLKGAKFAGGKYDKLNWIPGLNWDLLIIDEAHEGIDTRKTDLAFTKIKRKFELHLSGTPFKALANNKFSEEQIYNWSYLEEQEAKDNWSLFNGTNPYERMPKMNMFTYQLSEIVEDKLKKGLILEDDEKVNFAFDLTEFFRTKNDGTFIHEDSIKLFLDNLSKGKFPFAEKEHQQELNHTFWLLPRVASAKALEKMLNIHPFFKEYKTILAAGDGISLSKEELEENTKNDNYDISYKPEGFWDDDKAYLEQALDEKSADNSYNRVKEAINKYDKTITLSVGQLTTGVTVPEWTAVLMLSNIKSPSLYFQAAFRAQNPHMFQKNNNLYIKENSYVFDFAPDRTLVLYDEFANNLKGSSDKFTDVIRKENIIKLINFFPVIAEDRDGNLKELNVDEVLIFPNTIKAKKVVKRGFMDNDLFKDIYGIFRAPQIVKDILNKLPKETNGMPNFDDSEFPDTEDVYVDDDGNIEIPEEIVINTSNDIFGEKIYKTYILPEEISNETSAIESAVNSIKNQIEYNENNFQKLKNNLNITSTKTNQAKKEFDEILDKEIEKEVINFVNFKENHEKEKALELEKAVTEDEKEDIENRYKYNYEKQEEQFSNSIANVIETAEEYIITDILEENEEEKKNDVEDELRKHLRGFSRTIPAFLMAYGTDKTTLENFEQNINDETFEELTNITKEEFRKLRDGFYYEDEEGNNRKYNGFFNEGVFNASIREFMNKKEELANYFDENLDDDIFNYIPPQKNNQIFTPKYVVKLMVDKLEEEDQDIFKNYNTKFADLYCKSGLFLTEIVKRLNNGLKEQIPNDEERIKHILENQIYGVAPTNITYDIVKNFIYPNNLNINKKNIVKIDLADAAKNNTMQEELQKHFGGDNVKFDVVIGNPPYQEETIGENKTYAPPIYHNFLESSYNIADKAMFITPARFLFNAGSTPKVWNQKMLNDKYLKVVYYEINASKVFPNTDIKGGVAVTYRDINSKFESIQTFIPYNELRNIKEKVNCSEKNSLMRIIYAPESYSLTEQLHKDYPDAEAKLSKGHKYDLKSNIFDKLPIQFVDKVSPVETDEYVRIYGRKNNERVYKWMKRKYIEGPDNFEKYKVFLPGSNGSGAIGETLSTPLIGQPLIGHTETFMSFGKFDTQFEAEACLKYIKSKFARALLGILKVTQSNKSSTWRYVPLQDFTPNSDIDWTKSIMEIDKQLYKKYGLNEEEINFIETNVQAME